MTQSTPCSPRTTRFLEGERLYLKLLSEGRGALFVTASSGADEVAGPAVIATGGELIAAFVHPDVPAPTMPPLGSTEFPRWVACAPRFPDDRVETARVVVLVDDGSLTAAAITSLACGLRRAGARRLVVAAPWLHPLARRALAMITDRVVTCAQGPRPLRYDTAPHERPQRSPAAFNDAISETVWS